ncbi:hypothetical protein DNTS_009029 [Danionella cerebrum]|uniref:Uncharacterized protein n=1 Tax=Danionella cerebrum TaxID=2873325 RepID=A0A553MQ65_9TELE|nr:hypothetical protein DNTS_009029 [Danionella translucida]
MADKTMSVTVWSPSFVQELLPVAEKTALLYHLSYLCLAGFSNLERILRSRAVETQLLFGSSDATMVKCILTSDNMVTTLFPMLLTVVDKNRPDLAVKYLNKAKVWIKDIIADVNKIVERYVVHNNDVASSTSDVIKEKNDTDQKIIAQSQEIVQMENTLKDLKGKLEATAQEMAAIEEKINLKTNEIYDYTKSSQEVSKGLSILSAIVPFVGSIIQSIYGAVKDPEQIAKIQALESEMKVLSDEKTSLGQKHWQIELEIIDWQMKLAQASFELNSIPDPVYLDEVQKSLSKIQGILGQLKNFWENVGNMLDYLEQKTFIGQEMIEDLDLLRDEFVKAVSAANEAWRVFGESCKKAAGIFQLQSKDAYKFLEVNPSSLSKEEWQKAYDGVKERLQNIEPAESLPSSDKLAILE